ncbi:MAG TPA: aminotransferase class IV [Pirellulales bacterium]|nr:aminotransferase class IV [Pirellulales bacterium]
MNEAQAYLNGRFVPCTQASVPISDAGFVLGATVSEQLRSFGGKLFRLEDHLGRLAHSLEAVGLDPRISPSEIARIAQQLATHNHRLVQSSDDLNLTMFFTPGPYSSMIEPGAATSPTVCIHTFPLPFRLWADKYVAGQSLVTTSVEQVSPRSWPRSLKCRSRMHYYLADAEAARIEPQARAILLDEQGFITEATTANVLIYTAGQGLVGPPHEKVLPGISLAVLVELAQRAGIPYGQRDLRPEDLAAADEVLLASTSISVIPVTRFNGQPIGRGKPGPVQEMLLAAWSRLVGVDIAAQANRFATR